MIPEHIVIPYSNISLAWAEVFLRTFGKSNLPLPHPMMLSISEFDEHMEPVEDPVIREVLDHTIDCLNEGRTKKRVQGVYDTACTIFPHMCWSTRKPRPADEFFSHYEERVYPRLKKLSHLNAPGTYFLRMIAATGVKQDHKTLKPVNQLAEIIGWCKRERDERNKHMRQSALQVGIYDPAKDHTGSAQSGFPCLQQVSFGYGKEGLIVTGYYPTEFIFDRGYGNYLGLCWLGAFMAHELEMDLECVNVFVALPKRGTIPVKDLKELIGALRPLVDEHNAMLAAGAA